MVDAKKTFQSEAHRTIAIVFLYEFLIAAVPDFCGDLNEQDCAKKTPPLWWFICVFAVPVPLYLILKRIDNGPRKEFTNKQEKIVKGMLHAFKCSGYSAELIAVKVCGNENRYVRFTPISERETERVKILVKEFQDVFLAQKNEAKNKSYDPALWKPLEGQWEEVNRFCLGKMKRKLLFNGVDSMDTFRSQHVCDFSNIPCVSIPTKVLSYHLKGNLLLSDSNPLLYSEIFRLPGNYSSVAFYRCGSRAIWKVEGSTCMMFNFEGTLLSENDMISTSFWSTQEPIGVYHKVGITDIETNPMVHGQFV